ncbi:MAG: NUDIX domain-containing protein [Candidatus Omnitrophica bacterium]|nr:NUDIX domain-containing protein [Candidatus Omnitrophota bacterium]
MLEKEFAAGALVYRKKTIYPYVVFLLVYSGRNKIWGFPKGHLEPGEDEEAAARRELAEETGIINPVFIKGFRQEDAYRTLSTRPGREGTPIEKHCVYFLCRNDSEDVLVDGLEITDYRWLDTIEAEKLIAFAGLKDILKKAFIFLEPRKTYK